MRHVEYVELGHRIAIVIMPGLQNGRELQGIWLKQLKFGELNWDLFLKQGCPFLDDNVGKEFLLARTGTVDDAENYAKRLSNRLKLRIFRVENNNLRGTHRIIEST